MRKGAMEERTQDRFEKVQKLRKYIGKMVKIKQ